MHPVCKGVNMIVRPEPDDVRIQGKGSVFVKINSREYPLKWGYNQDISSIKDTDTKKEFVNFLISGDEPEIPFKGGSFPTPKENKNIFAYDDPEPGKSLCMLNYSSLQSVQWHLVCHGFADIWLNPKKPYVLNHEYREDAIRKIWKKFIQDVQCPRWGFDFENNPKAKKEWEKKYHRRSEKQNVSTQGCLDCINEHGMDQFTKCCNFMKEYRQSYLKRIRKWVVDTIQDAPYVQGKANPTRRHTHNSIADKPAVIYAYVIEKNSCTSFLDIFLLIYQINRNQNGEISYCYLKTTYGLNRKQRLDKCVSYIHKYSKKNKKNTISHYCHPDNWNFKQYGD